MKSIRPVLPNPSRTMLSNSGNVGAAAVLFANATMSGWPIAALIAANILSNGRDEIRVNRSTSTVAIIPNAFLAGLDERAEYLGPIFLETGVALESASQHGVYTVLSFGPPECCAKRSKGVEEPIERPQRERADRRSRSGVRGYRRSRPVRRPEVIGSRSRIVPPYCRRSRWRSERFRAPARALRDGEGALCLRRRGAAQPRVRGGRASCSHAR